MVTFRDIQLVLNKSPSACKASLGRAGSFDDVFTQFIWPLLSHPHQGRKGLLVGEKNKCIASLPKLECSFGPKIIFYYNKNTIDEGKEESDSNICCKIKFIYKLHHASRDPSNYINIIEHMSIGSNIFVGKVWVPHWNNFTALLREMYVAGLNEDKNVDFDTMLSKINVKTYYNHES